VFGNILQRLILRELSKVFFLSLVGITGILLMAGIIAEASQQGLSPAQVLEIIPLLIPSTLPYTIPATTLFATSVVYGRLAADNEILAIKAAGINMSMVIWPGVLLGVLMSALTMGLYYRIIPYTHGLMRSMFLNDVEDALYAVLRKDHAINQPRLTYAMWVRQVQDRKLLYALFKRRDANGKYDVIAWAREAELRVDMNNKQILLHMRNGLVLSDRSDNGAFVNHTWEVPLPPNFGNDRPLRPRDMTWQQLLAHRRDMLRVIQETKAEIALSIARIATTQAPADLPAHLENLRTRLRHFSSELWGTETELYMRPALSVGCLCFILVGCPVGIWFSRSDYLSAFITCFLPIVFVYYPLMLCATNFAKEGKLHAALTSFLADIIVAVVGLELFRRLLKY
jgi:lipopolysaccharide export system permease protein